MKCKHISGNCVEISNDNVSLLFSYAVLVGAHISGQGYYVTDRRYSSTTSKHINAWVGGANKTQVSQQWLDEWIICIPPLERIN
jgi:hypothetical protein